MKAGDFQLAKWYADTLYDEKMYLVYVLSQPHLEINKLKINQEN